MTVSYSFGSEGDEPEEKLTTGGRERRRDEAVLASVPELTKLTTVTLDEERTQTVGRSPRVARQRHASQAVDDRGLVRHLRSEVAIEYAGFPNAREADGSTYGKVQTVRVEPVVVLARRLSTVLPVETLVGRRRGIGKADILQDSTVGRRARDAESLKNALGAVNERSLLRGVESGRGEDLLDNVYSMDLCEREE
jgi:hypothetical protein